MIPPLQKTNSPFSFFGVMLLIVGITATVYLLLPSAVHVSQPVLDFSSGQVIATSEISNHTAKCVTLTLRFDLIYTYPGTKVSPAYDLSLAYREIVTSVDAYSSRSVSCEFPMPHQGSPNTASVKIINSK